MTSIASYLHVENRGVTRFKSILRTIEDAIEKRRIYMKTLAELETLNERELADLGMSRYDLPAVAKEAAYGA